VPSKELSVFLDFRSFLSLGQPWTFSFKSILTMVISRCVFCQFSFWVALDRSPYTFLRSSRWIEGSHWGVSASEICSVASIAAVLKLIVIFLGEKFFLREQTCVNARKKNWEFLICLSFHFEKKRQLLPPNLYYNCLIMRAFRLKNLK
jgi:hypothetical protein